MSRHVHVVFSIECNGKADSFYGKCWCGKEEQFATWWPHPPKGWSKKQWELLNWGAMLFLRSIYPNTADQWTDEELKKYQKALSERRKMVSRKKK